MVQQRTNKTRCSISTSRLLFIVLSCSVVTLSNIFCCAVTAWTPPPADTHNRRQYLPNNHQSSSNNNIRPLFSTVDELYYNPTSASTNNGVFETSPPPPLDDSTTSEEMEIAAQNYGCGTAGGGNTAGSGSSQQKITLTRWLQAKVQDYPEVRGLYNRLCVLILIDAYMLCYVGIDAIM